MKKEKYPHASHILILPFDANRILTAYPRRVELTTRQARRNVYLKPSAPVRYLQLVVFSPEGKVIPELSKTIEVPSEAWSMVRTMTSRTNKPTKPAIRIYLGKDVSQYRDSMIGM